MTETLLLDEFLPAYDHVVSVSQVFRAPADVVFEAAVTLDLYRLPLARVLLGARGLPARISDARARRRGEAVTPEPRAPRSRRTAPTPASSPWRPGWRRRTRTAAGGSGATGGRRDR
jgi:hypothetical protein